ncbi:MAG: hypothetical protein R6U89_04010 [Dehalococcoidia bacterium]
MREENSARETLHRENVMCPGCGRTLRLDMCLSRMEGILYIWFEGLCPDCCHKIVDPMPRAMVNVDEHLWKLISN